MVIKGILKLVSLETLEFTKVLILSVSKRATSELFSSNCSATEAKYLFSFEAILITNSAGRLLIDDSDPVVTVRICHHMAFVSLQLSTVSEKCLRFACLIYYLVFVSKFSIIVPFLNTYWYLVFFALPLYRYQV